jgi:hypothetical protein
MDTRNLKLFPTTVVDDFYEDPDAVREFALSLPFENGYNYPGLRTPPLGDIEPEFFHDTTAKWLNLFFDVENTKMEWNVSSCFQLIESFGDDPIYNEGWIHKDGNSSIAACIIYLTPDIEMESGTDIYRLDDNIDVGPQEIRLQWFEHGIRSEQYERELRANNKKFTRTISVENVYNRMITFGGNAFHGVRSYDTSVPRLTQVMFLHSLDTKVEPPMQRVMRCPR